MVWKIAILTALQLIIIILSAYIWKLLEGYFDSSKIDGYLKRLKIKLNLSKPIKILLVSISLILSLGISIRLGINIGESLNDFIPDLQGTPYLSSTIRLIDASPKFDSVLLSEDEITYTYKIRYYIPFYNYEVMNYEPYVNVSVKNPPPKSNTYEQLQHIPAIIGKDTTIIISGKFIVPKEGSLDVMIELCFINKKDNSWKRVNMFIVPLSTYKVKPFNYKPHYIKINNFHPDENLKSDVLGTNQVFSYDIKYFIDSTELRYKKIHPMIFVSIDEGTDEYGSQHWLRLKEYSTIECNIESELKDSFKYRIPEKSKTLRIKFSFVGDDMRKFNESQEIITININQ